MQLIQILLPLYNNEKQIYHEEIFSSVKKELTEKFGGITVYTRSPATGLWKENENKTVKDDIVIYEIMAGDLDRDWWMNYKEKLQKIFQQNEIIFRTWEAELL